MKILAIDDDAIALRLIAHALSRYRGYEVRTTTCASEGFRAISEGHVHLVIADWMMPGMTGVELCRKVRAAELSYYPYIIIATARDGVEDMIEALAAGADEFIRKPFHPAELGARVRSMKRLIDLHGQPSERVGAHARGASPDGSPIGERAAELQETLRESAQTLLALAARLGETSPSPEQVHLLHRLRIAANQLLSRVEEVGRETLSAPTA